MPADSQESISTETNDNCITSQTDANLPDAELSVDQIIKLHQQGLPRYWVQASNKQY